MIFNDSVNDQNSTSTQEMFYASLACCIEISSLDDPWSICLNLALNREIDRKLEMFKLFQLHRKF